MTGSNRPVEINMSGIPVSGVGGLGLVALVAVMTVVLPEAWWIVVLGAIGGVVLGVVLVMVRRLHVASGPSGSDPTVLFRVTDPLEGIEESKGSKDSITWSIRPTAAAGPDGLVY